jgi:hypothetical protein
VDGRSLRWRLLMLAGGMLLGGYGALVIWRPQVLTWTVAVVFVAVGAFCVASALLARGPRS